MDKRSNALLARHRRILPERDIRAGARAANRKILRMAQRNTVRAITKTTPLKRSAFIGRKGQRRFSGVRIFNGLNGVFWLVVKDYVLHRTGKVVQLVRNRRVRALSGRLLRRRIDPSSDAFLIYKSAYIRKNGKVASVKLAVHGKISSAFNTGIISAARKAPVVLHETMRKQFEKYQRRLRK